MEANDDEGRVIDAAADHGNDQAITTQLGHGIGFIAWQQVGDEFINAECVRNVPGPHRVYRPSVLPCGCRLCAVFLRPSFPSYSALTLSGGIFPTLDRVMLEPNESHTEFGKRYLPPLPT